MSGPSSPVRLEPRGRAMWITIDRPDRRNAINADVIAGLRDGLPARPRRPRDLRDRADRRRPVGGDDRDGIAAVELDVRHGWRST